MSYKTKSSQEQIIHIRHDGVSLDVLLSDLDLGSFSDDKTIRRAVADYLGIQHSKLQNHRVDRHPNGNLTIRPQAVFG